MVLATSDGCRRTLPTPFLFGEEKVGPSGKQERSLKQSVQHTHDFVGLVFFTVETPRPLFQETVVRICCGEDGLADIIR